MHNALTASSVLPNPLPHQRIVDLRSLLRVSDTVEKSAWSALQEQLGIALDQHSHEIHIDTDTTSVRLQVRTLGRCVETRFGHNEAIHPALNLLRQQLWPDQLCELSQRAWFLLPLHERDYLFQIDHLQTSAGSTFTLRRLYDIQHPLPQLEELITLPTQAAGVRHCLQQYGLVLLADTDRISRIRTARAMAQCLTGPHRRILLSETSCHPLVPGTTQITLPLDASREQIDAWQQACDMSHDVVIALKPEQGTAQLCQYTAQNALVVQGVTASSASQALTQLIGFGIRPEAIASTLKSIVIQRWIAIACEHCKCPCQLDDKHDQWLCQQAPMRTGAIQDWLAERLSDNFVQTPGCDACKHTGIGEITLLTDCVTISQELQDALCDGDVRYVLQQLNSNNPLAAQIIRLAQQGTLSIAHAAEHLQFHA